jgi:hypothetical protein
MFSFKEGRGEREREREREKIKEGKVRGGGFRLRMGNWELRREKRIKK